MIGWIMLSSALFIGMVLALFAFWTLLVYGLVNWLLPVFGWTAWSGVSWGQAMPSGLILSMLVSVIQRIIRKRELNMGMR